VEKSQDADTTGFGLDFWRLPFPSDELVEDDEEVHDYGFYCCSFDFWKVPLADLAEDNADCGAQCLNVTPSGSSGSTCGVCLVDFVNGDELRLLPCGHRFHRECIDHWLLQSSTVCPVCKTDLRSEGFWQHV